MSDAVQLLSRGRMRREAMAALPPALRPVDEAGAYRLQARLHRYYAQQGMGEVAGYKIGCTTEVMQRYLGIPNPCAGGLLAPTLRRGHGAFAHGDFVRVGVECELAARLAGDLPGGGVVFDRGAVALEVDAVMAAIEVVDDRWQDYPGVDTPTLIADDFFGAGCVLGEPCTEWRRMDLAGLGARMWVNRQMVGEGRGADILGHPLEALAWLATTRSAMTPRGEAALAGGSVVLLGSMVQTRWLARGDRVEIEVDGLGRVTAAFD
jgi:2-oxo-3-hexenedioate decarboxylase/2-keto-4-pentenoate hydratase